MMVRPAKAGDEPKIFAILTACELLTPQHADWTGILLVAERQTEIVGFIHALPGKPFSVITQMGVLPAHQKGRAGYKLIESMELLLRSMGFPHWVAYVAEKNAAMRGPIEGWGAYTDGGTGMMYRRTL